MVNTFKMLPLRHIILVIYFCYFLFAPVNSFDNENNPFARIVKKLLVATARNCMDHVNATIDDLEYLRNDPPWPEKSACIVKCLLDQLGVVKNNRYSKEGLLTVVTPMIFTNKKKVDHMKTVSENCEKEISHEEDAVCKLGNEIPTCVFKYAPELHFKT